MAGITISGVGSGLDINSLVTQLVAAERLPTETRLNKQETQVQAKLSALGTIKGAMSSFQGALSGVRFASAITARSATSADNDIFTASATDSATLGSHSVEVTDLAQAHKLSTDAEFNSSSDAIGTGIITFQFGTFDGATFTTNANKPTKSITIDSSKNSLQGIRDAVNSANFGVRASIIDDGSGKQRLSFASQESGAANSMKITVADNDTINDDTSGLSKLAYDPEAAALAGKNLNSTQDAKDAKVKVDGINITRSSNTITGAIEGVTLNLIGKSQAGTPTNLTIGQDSSKAFDAIKGFVDQYNNVMTAVNDVATYNQETRTAGVLLGDSSVRGMVNQLRGILNSEVSDNGSYNSLSSIGIKTQRDGSLDLDTEALQNAISDDPEAIGRLLGVVGQNSDSLVKFSGYLSTSKTGIYDINVTQLATQGYWKGSAAFPSAFPFTVTNLNQDFALKVNGIQSGVISLSTGLYNSSTDLAAEMQSRINSDDTLKNAGVSVTVGYDVDRFKITSSIYGSNSKVEMTAVDTNSNADLGFSVGTGTDGVNVAGYIYDSSAQQLSTQGYWKDSTAFPSTFPFAVTAGNTDFALKVNGTQSGTISLSQKTYNSSADLAAEMQNKINADNTLKNAGISVAVSYDVDRFKITSGLYGNNSKVEMTTSNAALGFSASTGTDGVYNPTDGLGASGFGRFLTSKTTRGFLEGSANSSLSVNANNDNFSIKVNDTQSNVINLTTGTYSNGAALAAEMQSQINADDNLSNAGIKVIVDYDKDHFKITSKTYGSDSKVELTSVDSTSSATLGLNVSKGTDGVTGSTNGAGLKVEIAGGVLGARGQLNFSRGIGDQLYNTTNRFLSLTGTFAKATNELNDKTDDINTQRDKLEERLATLETRYRNQFMRLDSLISKMKSTGDYLTQQLFGSSSN